MKKVIVDEEKCIRCGACIQFAETVFKSGPDGQSVPAVDVVSDDDKDAVAAMECCPTSAISLEDASECECEHCECGDDCECGNDCECGDDCECEDCDCEHKCNCENC